MFRGPARCCWVIMGWGVLAQSADAACPSNSESLRVWADAGLVAHVNREWSELDVIFAALQEEANCLSEVVTVEDAEQIHRFFAFAAGSQKDRERATAEWQAVYALNDGWVPPEDLARSGSLYRTTFDEAASRGAGPQYPVLSSGVWVDGRASAEVPLQRAAFVQIKGRRGLQTWYLDGEHELPADLRRAIWLLEVTPAVLQEEFASRSLERIGALDLESAELGETRRREAVPMFVLAGVAGAVSVTGMVIAADATADFDALLQDVDDPQNPALLTRAEWDMRDLERRNRNAGTLSAAGAALALGFFGAGIVLTF